MVADGVGDGEPGDEPARDPSAARAEIVANPENAGVDRVRGIRASLLGGGGSL